MNINSLHELAQMIARRDNISFNEAWILVCDTKNAILEIIKEGGPGETMYSHATDIIETDLGLEPDYLELFLYV